jgi:hypothetical protein
VCWQSGFWGRDVRSWGQSGNCLLPLKTSNLTRYNALSETWGGNEAPFHCRKYSSATPKHRNAPKATRNRGASIAGQETAVARLTNERDEALLRETANSEILRLISRSPGDLELVFRSILENATRICNANFGNLFRVEGEKFYPAAQFNTPAALVEALTRRGPFKPKPGTSLDHVMRTKQVTPTWPLNLFLGFQQSSAAHDLKSPSRCSRTTR